MYKKTPYGINQSDERFLTHAVESIFKKMSDHFTGTGISEVSLPSEY